MAALKDYKGEYAVQSFDPRIMGEIKKLAPEILRGQLIAGNRYDNVSLPVYLILKNGLMNFKSSPDFINMEKEFLPVKKRVRGGADVICWTVRSEEDKLLAQRFGVNYIFEKIRV